MRFGTILLLACFCAGCGSGIVLERPVAFDETSWRQLNGNGGRNAPVPSGPRPPFELAWQESVNSALGPAGALCANGLVCIPGLSGWLYFLDAETGADEGHIGLRGSIFGAPAGSDSLLAVPHAAFPATISCVDLRARKVRWTKAVGQIESSLLLRGNDLYATTLDGGLWRISLADSATRWSASLPKPIYSSPATDGERVFTGCNDGAVYAFTADSGRRIWKYATGAAVMASPVVSDSDVCVGSTNGLFFALQARDGSLRWSADLGSPVYATAAVRDGAIFIGTTGRMLFCLDAATGAIRWRAGTGSIIRAPALVTEEFVYAVSLDKTIRCLDRRTGREIWSQTFDESPATAPIVTPSRLIVATQSGDIYAFKSAEGK